MMKNSTKRKILMIKLKLLTILGKNLKKADLIRKSGVFKEFGQGGYWHPSLIPTHPSIISIGNNVTISADVKFLDHDIFHKMFNNDKNYIGPSLDYFLGNITVKDNTVIGANSIILYNVTLGKNVLVAAGSIVTKDVPDFSIVGGNPAKIIGDTRELLKKRLNLSCVENEKFDFNTYYKC